jgi:hypothetical protein
VEADLPETGREQGDSLALVGNRADQDQPSLARRRQAAHVEAKETGVMKHPSSRARRDDLNAHSTTWERLSLALNRRVLTPVQRTSSETNSAVFAIFVGMIARGAGIDATISRTLAFERLSRQERAFDARTRRETADPRPF